jgi:surfeit locus 1 family protein
MKPAVRRWAPLAIGIVVAAVCARLGVWQLDRLAQRRAQNARIEQQLSLSPLELPAASAAPAAAAAVSYRPVSATGTFDFSHQQVVVLRPRDGVPGVFLATPLMVSDSSAILVERGWVPSPDGKTVALETLAEPTETTVEGHLVEGDFSAPPPDAWPGYVRRASPALVPGAPAFPLVLRRTVLPPGAPDVMQPMLLPGLTNGPHLSYAIQWFAFGIIALVGSGLLVAKGGKGEGVSGERG